MTAALVPAARNPKLHSDDQVEAIARLIDEFGWTMPVLVDEADEIIAGHGRILAAAKRGIAAVPVVVAVGWTDAQKRAYRIADNKVSELGGGWDDSFLRLDLLDLSAAGFNLDLTGIPKGDIGDLLNPQQRAPSVSLSDKFGIPPFSVLNAREGWWQNRKRAWLALGIQSEIGRGELGTNGPHEGSGMADGLVSLRNKEKAARGARRPNAIPGGGAHAAGSRKGPGAP